MGNQEEVLEELNKKMALSAQERRYEEALEYKNMIQQIESTGNKQIVRDAIDGDATVMVALDKYNHLFLSVVEIKNSMIVGVHEYRLANPLDDPRDDILEQGMLQYLSSEGTKMLYTDIHIRTMKELMEYAKVEKIRIKQPSRGEKVRILEFAHTNLLNFAYQEEMS